MAKTKRDRNIDIHRYATNVPDKFIDISVSYCEGGNIWGRENARAYYLHCGPVEIENWEGHTIKKYTLFKGRKAKLEDARRFSQKRLYDLAAAARKWVAAGDPQVMQLVTATLAEENLTLVETETAHA